MGFCFPFFTTTGGNGVRWELGKISDYIIRINCANHHDRFITGGKRTYVIAVIACSGNHQTTTVSKGIEGVFFGVVSGTATKAHANDICTRYFTKFCRLGQIR